MFEKFQKMIGVSGSSKSEPDADTLWTTPWDWRDAEDVYTGHNGHVWMYRALPVNPLEWEDPEKRLGLGQQIATLLATIGSTSGTPLGAIRQLSNNREIHLINVSWEEEAKPPEGTSPRLAEYQESALGFTVPKRALFLGVRLRTSRKGGETSMSKQLVSAATKMLAEDVPDRSAYNADREQVGAIIARFGGRKLNPSQQAQLESWYNLGRGPDVTIVEESTSLRISNFDTLEMSAVMRFNNPIMSAPNAQWVLDAITHPDGPRMVSVRAELEPSAVARSRARRAQRRVKSSMEEEAATGDLERVELSSTFQQAQAFEHFLADANEPILTNCSIIMARSITDTDETYIDWLRDNYQIDMKPLEHRQIRALDESLPCSSRRVNPFLQDISISMLAYAGFNGFSNLGDSKGAYLGLADPDGTPVFLDPLGAPAANQPPAMLIAGDPGSGKTFVSQSLAVQAVLAGITAIFINPKGFDSLSTFADLVNGNVIKMSALEGMPGAFDPFLYSPPEIAAEMATSHILSVLEAGFTQAQRLDLSSALKRAAYAGARCVGDAFAFIEDNTVITQIKQQVEGSSLFALGVALEPRPRFDDASGLTLIEFDRELGLPDPGKAPSDHTTGERIALAAIRLITRASMEILAKSGGGMMVVDEAWTFLGHETGLAALQRLGREGRSLNILPIFATQRISDVITRDMESYISRVLVMQMRDEKEIRASLNLCGLEATKERIKWVKSCGYQKGDEENGVPERLPMALHRDLKNRHAAVVLGPIPEAARIAFSTNPEDRRKRQQALEEENGQFTEEDD